MAHKQVHLSFHQYGEIFSPNLVSGPIEAVEDMRFRENRRLGTVKVLRYVLPFLTEDSPRVRDDSSSAIEDRKHDARAESIVGFSTFSFNHARLLDFFGIES